MTKKIMTLHPDKDKQGVNIDAAIYEQVKDAILTSMKEAGGELAFRDLPNAVGKKLPQFAGSVGWYTTTIKLDLEARGLIERVPGSSPQRLRLMK